MRATLRYLMAWLVGTIVATTAAVISSTQFVLAELVALGMPIPLPMRLGVTAYDLYGMGPIYWLIVATGFALAMPVGLGIAALLGRWKVPVPMALATTLAGAVAVGAALVGMNEVTGLIPIAGARTVAGLTCQLLSGALGGFVFARIARSGGRS